MPGKQKPCCSEDDFRNGNSNTFYYDDRGHCLWHFSRKWVIDTLLDANVRKSKHICISAGLFLVLMVLTGIISPSYKAGFILLAIAFAPGAVFGFAGLIRIRSTLGLKVKWNEEIGAIIHDLAFDEAREETGYDLYLPAAKNIAGKYSLILYIHGGGFTGRSRKEGDDILNETSPKEPTCLMVLPFLQGMGGTPDVDPAATGLIAGLTTQTRLPDIYRAILEGITFEMRYNMEKLEECNVRIQRLLACGGGARSPIWLQIKADILGCEIIPIEIEETGAMGSAILGFAAVIGERPMQIAARFQRYAAPIHKGG